MKILLFAKQRTPTICVSPYFSKDSGIFVDIYEKDLLPVTFEYSAFRDGWGHPGISVQNRQGFRIPKCYPVVRSPSGEDEVGLWHLLEAIR